jgi:hypothetical protein
MDQLQLALMIGLACGAILGYFVARRSNQRDKIDGGMWAQVFHYIGASSVVGILPTVLTCLILGLGFRTAFPLALTFLLTGWIALMIYAVFERSARVNLSAEDRGWTREDASKSH